MGIIEVKQLNCDLMAVTGLALAEDYLKTVEPVLKRVDKALPVRAGVANSDIVRSCVGLLGQGKSDFDAIENLKLTDAADIAARPAQRPPVTSSSAPVV